VPGSQQIVKDVDTMSFNSFSFQSTVTPSGFLRHRKNSAARKFCTDRVWTKTLLLSLSALFLTLMHIFAQSLMTTVVGPPLPVSGGAALGEHIDFPWGVATDPAGRLYIVSNHQNRVYAVTPDGTLLLVAGSSYGFGGDGGTATEAKLAAPAGVAADSAGNVYIADTRNNRIREVIAGGAIRTVAGNGVPGFSGDGGPAASAALSGPQGVAVDSAGNLYIADTNNLRIRKVTPEGVISTFAGGGTASDLGVKIPATSAQLVTVNSVAVDRQGNVYLADRAVHRVSTDGTITTVVGSTPAGRFNEGCLSNGDGGPASAASVCSPKGLAIDPAGNLYITESYSYVRRVTTDGIINTFAGNGSLGSTGDAGPARSAAIGNPFGITVDATGNLYIAQFGDNHVREVTPDGIISTVAGASSAGFSGDGGPAVSAQISGSFYGVNAVATDPAGSLYIADTDNNRVRKVTVDGIINTLGLLTQPKDVFADTSGNVYVLANNGQIFRIGADRVPQVVAGTGGPGCVTPDSPVATQHHFCNPQRIAVDTAGTLYVAEELQIKTVGSDGIVRTVAGTGTSGPASDGVPALSASIGVAGFALNPAGGFYIGGGNRIQKVTPDGLIHTIAGGSPVCPPQGAPNGDGGPALSAQVCGPTGIALDPAGNLYLADVWHSIRMISPNGIITRVAGNGVPGFSGDGGPAASAQFASPTDVAVDAAGNLYIADQDSARIRKVSPFKSSHSFDIGSSAADYSTAAPLTNTTGIGYGTIQVQTGQSTPAGIEIFSYRPGGVLISETAVPAASLSESGRIFTESSGPVRTGIAIANPNDQDAVISFYFTDQNGSNLNGGTTTIPAHQQIASFLDEAPYYCTGSAVSFTYSSSAPVGAIALRAFVNERSETLLTTLPVAPVSNFFNAPAGGSVIIPHFTAGGGWTTQVLLVNPTNVPLNGTVTMDATYRYAIAPRSSSKIVSGSWDAPRTGNIVVNPAQGTALPVVSTVFSQVTNGVTVTETGVATTGIASSFRVYAEFDLRRQLQTGIAIANTGSNTANIQFDLLTLDGQTTGYSGSSTLDPGGHIAKFLNEIPGLQNLPGNFRGVLHISSNQPISAFGLRTLYNERADFLFAATPAITDNAAVTGELIFPQVVSGVGFTTEFILMNTGAQSQGILNLISQSGTDLPLFAQ
jgi:sugar lactone lactonase YvrE